MALINCTECGNEISDKALACPKCGALLENMKITKKTPVSVLPNDLPVQKKKSSGGKVILILAIIFLVGIVLVILNNNPNSMPGIKFEINTPKPLVLQSRADQSKSGLLKLRTTVYATILNQGGDGNVLVTFHVSQAGNDYDRSKSINLRSNESVDLEETFDEVRMLDGQITYNVDAVAQ